MVHNDGCDNNLDDSKQKKNGSGIILRLKFTVWNLL